MRDEYETQPDELPGDASRRRARLVRDIAEAVRQHSNDSLSDDERRWVRLAIEKEVQSIAFRRAVINKTISSLIWSAFIGLGYLLLDFLKNHGFKP